MSFQRLMGPDFDKWRIEGEKCKGYNLPCSEMTREELLCMLGMSAARIKQLVQSNCKHVYGTGPTCIECNLPRPPGPIEYPTIPRDYTLHYVIIAGACLMAVVCGTLAALMVSG